MTAVERMAEIQKLTRLLSGRSWSISARYTDQPSSQEKEPRLKIEWRIATGDNETEAILRDLFQDLNISNFYPCLHKLLVSSIEEAAKRRIVELQAKAREEFTQATGLNLGIVTRALKGQLERDQKKGIKYVRKSLKKAKARRKDGKEN